MLGRCHRLMSPVYLIGSRHDSTRAARSLQQLHKDDDTQEAAPLALGLELCHGRIGRMKLVKSKDIKALWQLWSQSRCSDSTSTPIISSLHALDVSPGEAAKEVFRDMPLMGIIRVAWYVTLRRVLSPLAERVLVWRLIYCSEVEQPLLDKWLMKWRVPRPIMKMARSMAGRPIDDIREAIGMKYPPKERYSYIRDAALDTAGYMSLCERYNVDKRLQEVVIDMRDEYMYRSLWRLASRYKRVAAVVGENHIDGVERRWKMKVESSTWSKNMRRFKFEEAGVFKQWLLMELLKQ
ncbi:hypothetical protein FOZ60_017182 [Perkinsus olseni]|uniref:Uncharacterized protein n=1 Tax=Perkinsus olseni TaxID=32597 RepID=A0A7J6P323_PEROL|nr:hypothetical protein FOZ60_017182 [Perkinsus olseni]